MCKTCTPYVLLFIATMALSYALSQVYPYPIAQPDTARYFYQGTGFQWNIPHLYDSWNPPLYAFVLWFSLQFPEPTVFVYWCNSLLFSASILVAFYVASQLFSSRVLGFFCAASLLALEVLLFRVPFYNVELLTEPFYIHTVFMGTALLALQLARTGYATSLAGSALLSAAVMTRRIGIALLCLWVPIILWQIIRLLRSSTQKQTQIHLVIALLIITVPISLWTVRGKVFPLEGQGSITGQYLLWRMFDIRIRHNIVKTQRLNLDTLDLEKAFNGENAEINKKIVAAHRNGNGNDYTSEMASVRMEVASLILQKYFFEFLQLLLHDYYNFFHPQYIWSMEYIAFRPNPNHQYDEMRDKKLDPKSIALLYPNGMPESQLYNRRVALILQKLCCENAVIYTIRSWGNGVVYLVHAYALCMWVALFWMWKRKRNTKPIICVISIMLLMAFIHAFATVVITNPTEIRLALPGSLLIHYSLALGVGYIVFLIHKAIQNRKTQYKAVL